MAARVVTVLSDKLCQGDKLYCNIAVSFSFLFLSAVFFSFFFLFFFLEGAVGEKNSLFKVYVKRHIINLRPSCTGMTD